MRRPIAPLVVTFGVVAAAVGVVLWQFQPHLLLSNTTITGGDTGAHVATAAFLQSSLLPHGHITGWDPGWYDGFPLYTFYFPLPDVLAAVAGWIIPFNVAFKLATALGSLTLPVAAWAFGRLAGLERPRPAILAAATLPFLFDQSWTIYGGNIFSTMAGEYAYSLGLSVALVFLGVVVRGLRTGRMRVWAAVLLAACMLCHLVAGMFAVTGAVALFVLMGPSRRRLWWLVASLGTGALLVAFWAVPFVLDEAYTTNMGWVNVRTFMALFAPAGNIAVLAVAGVGALVAVTRRQRPMILFVVLGVGAYLATVFDPQGKLYNTRFVPLWWLCVYLLAGSMVAEVAVLVAQLWRRGRLRVWWESTGAPRGITVPEGTGPGDPVVGGARLAVAGGSPGPLPVVEGWVAPPTAGSPPRSTASGTEVELRPGGGPPGPGGFAGGSGGPPSGPGSERGPARGEGDVSAPRPGPGAPEDEYERPAWRWAPAAIGGPLLGLVLALAVVLPPLVPRLASGVDAVTGWRPAASAVPSWVSWNYSGYQAKPSWPEYEAVIHMTERATSRYGCGRAFWEYNSDLQRFGTPMALMLLPYWTDGCVNTQEGLLFESAGTTPFHFIDQSELSAAPSDAVVSDQFGFMSGSAYSPTVDVPLGVQHLQLLGVRYLLASSPTVQDQADADRQLTLIGTTGPWPSSYSTTPTTWKLYLVHDAPVVSPLTDQPEVLTGVSAAQPQWLPVATRWYLDPKAWATELVADGPAGWARTGSSASGPRVALPKVTVSDVRTTNSGVSFHVSRTGVPVLVKVSYFPAWHATGAQGPWRAEPNLMVVVPTSHDVSLHYGTDRAGELGTVLSVAGLVAVGLLWWRRRADSWT